MDSFCLKIFCLIGLVFWVTLNAAGEPGIICKRLVGHTDSITAVALHGDKAFTGSRDGTTKAWDVHSGQCLCTFTGHTAEILNVAASDDKVVTGSNDETVKVWDIKSGHCLYTFQGFSTKFRTHSRGNAFVLLDNKVFVGCLDGTTKVWDINNGHCLQIFWGHSKPVSAIAVEGDILVTGSVDKTVRTWDMRSGLCLRILAGHTDRVTAVAIDRDKIISGSADHSVKTWDRESGNCLRTLSGYNIFCVDTIGLWGNTIIACSEEIEIWDINTGQLLNTFHDQEYFSACAISCDKIITSAYSSGAVQIWDINSKRCLHTFSGGEESRKIAADGDKIIIGYRDGTATIWTDMRPLGREVFYEMEAFAAALHPHCGQISAASILNPFLLQEIGCRIILKPWDSLPTWAESHKGRSSFCIIS